MEGGTTVRDPRRWRHRPNPPGKVVAFMNAESISREVTGPTGNQEERTMWKREEAQPDQPPAEQPRPEMPKVAASRSGMAMIGPSIWIRGDVTGSEDLLIQGRVDGSVTLDLHTVSVGSEGRVNANITGRVIVIEGEVEGDLTALEQIVLLGSARVQGDIKAPRVVLKDGATFRGLVDMGIHSDGEEAAATETADEAENGLSTGTAVNGAAEKRDAPAKSRSVAKDSSGRSTPARSSSGPDKGTVGAVGPPGS